MANTQTKMANYYEVVQTQHLDLQFRIAFLNFVSIMKPEEFIDINKLENQNNIDTRL